MERHVDFELALGTLEIQTSNFNTQLEDYDVLFKEKESILMKFPNIHFNAFKTPSSIVCMTFRCGDVNVSSKKRHVIT